MGTKSHPSSPVQSRAPLLERSNTISRTSARRAVRDSDESSSGNHSSVFDAGRMSYEWNAAERDTAKVRSVSPRPIKILPSNQPTKIRLEDLRSESPLSRLRNCPFLYGHGTKLHPIAEQRSITALRTASYSTSDLSSAMPYSTGSHTQAPSAQARKSRLRRKESRSLNYLNHLERDQTIRAELDISKHISFLSSTDGTEGYTPAQDLHTYPYSPPYSPPARVCSPPSQLANSSIDTPSRDFRGLRSAHGNMKRHPWVRLVQSPLSEAGSGSNRSYQRNLTDMSLEDGSGSRADVVGGGTSSWTCKRCHRPADAHWSL